MAGMESMTNSSTLILDPRSVHIGLEDDKLYGFCKPGQECAKALGDENNGKIQFQLNKMERMESKTDYSTLILDPSVHIGLEDVKVYCSCSSNLDRKTVCQECVKAIQSHLKKMAAGLESKTLILDPPVHLVVEDVKLCKPGRKIMCEAAQFQDENNLMLSKIQLNSHLKKMALHLVGKNGNLSYMCQKCGLLADAQYHSKQKDENNLMCSKIQIQSQLNKMAGMESVPDWSGMLTELLAEIAVKLTLFEDFTAFRGVCTSWRAAATKDKFVSLSKVPLLMLAEKDGDGDVREFYSLCKGKVVTRMSVPEVKEKRCIGAGFGWILTVATSGGELNLVKPMSSSKINVPNMKTFPDYSECCPEHVFIVGQVALSANPSETSDFVLMVANWRTLGFWRNGDSHWTKVEGIQGFTNISFYRQKMYGIRQDGSIWTWGPYLNPAPEILLTLPRDLESYYLELSYMVESSKGELLLIMRMSPYRSEPEDYFKYFGVFQIDTVNGKYTEIDTLDQDAIFIGPSSGAVCADEFPGVIKANCIYFTDDDCEQWPWPDSNEEEYAWKPVPGTDMGIYHVEDGITERLDVESFSSICPPLWIFPSL